MWFPSLLLVLLTVLASSRGAGKQKPKSVTTFIDARWPAAPLLLEASEYLAEENTDTFWEFVDAMCHDVYENFHLLTEREQYEIVLNEVQNYITPSQVSLMKFALSLHNYLPRVEMFAQIAVDRMLPTDCVAAADVAGKLTCSVHKLRDLITNSDVENNAEIFELDHKYPTSQAGEETVVVVLYAEIGTPQFRDFHAVLKRLALEGRVHYVLRHYIREQSSRRVRLSGYGVELQIKSTEYKVQDDTKVKSSGGGVEDMSEEDKDDEVEGFNFYRLKTLYPDKVESLDRFHQHLLDSTSDLAPLKVWQLQELSLQAAERIINSPREEALKVLTHIAQNFPLQARSLVKTNVQPELHQEVKANQEAFAASLNLQPMDTALFLNGMFFDMDIVDIMTILEALRQELRVMEGLHRIGIRGKQTTPLMALDLSQNGVQEYAIDIRDSAVIYVNDIEKDKQYRRWPESLTELLRPTFPGMLRSIRRNLYNLVIIVDPSDERARALLKMAESFVVHSAPLRIGVVFAVGGGLRMLPKNETGKTNAGIALIEAFNYISEEKDGQHSFGLSFITDVYAAAGDGEITPLKVAELLKSKYTSADVDDIFGEDSDYDIGRRLAQDFVQRSGFRRLPQVLLNGIPLDEKSLVADEFEEAVLTEIMNQTPMFQKAVYKGELKERENPLDFAMNQPNVMPRLNERILQSKGSTNLNLMGMDPFPDDSTWKWFRLHGNQVSSQDLSAALINRAKYATRREDTVPKIITNWVVGDLETPKGRQLLADALDQMRSSNVIRVMPVLNPSSLPGTVESWDRKKFCFSSTVMAALSVMRSDVSGQFLSKILDEEAALAISSGRKTPEDFAVQGFDMSVLREAIEAFDDEALIRAHRMFCEQSLGLKSGGERAVVNNGRLLGPLDEDEVFSPDDFGLLERYAFTTYAEKITKALAKVGEDDDLEEDVRQRSDKIMKLVSLLVSRPQSKSRFEIPFRGDNYSAIKLDAPHSDRPAFDIVVIVDPVSRGAQKIGLILSTLLEVINCNLRVFLNPVEKNSDMPLKSFYRYVLEAEPQFTGDGLASPGPMARFINMPTSVLLTQNMHVPENWLVESVRSPYDLDNIRLDDVESTVHSEFELEYLLLEGHCFEQTMGNPPRGLQITLGTNQQPVVVDTIVMANLGYFQLKANPGAWLLCLRQGRSADIFDISSVDGTEVSQNSSGIKILISSFRSHVIKLKVAKKPHMLHVDLLADDESSSGIWNSITRTFGGSSTKEDAGDLQLLGGREEHINIFSLASGHLYERFIRIMMLSVLKHTRTPVKFWFLKNYLSPTFKDFLPHMAEAYKFEYELVQYKWPRWLHQQTEKQRIIWGYKILFLDVLFPLSVKKIIFVDADQVVRADMKELYDMDLGGAPYGYTPFCDSRKEMDGFRFWNQGYWKNHLQGRSYHISALYVVDLKRFRRIAAGDRLRGQYQALSQDPNSLSNLDQDLPNNMIHQVAIKSLPQEWLWCETWCDDESKKYAKTIDLCNNPLTKEAKLTAAMRIVKEWKDYDEEIKRLQESIGAEEHEDVLRHGSPAHTEL